MGERDRLRVAVVGTGEWWGYHHARVWHERPDTDLVAIVGRSPQKVAERSSAFGVPGYVDLGSMLDAERPDLVSLCLPNEGHYETTLQVIRAGFPLFVEKPITFDLAEADSLIEEAASRGLFFGLNFNHRYARPGADWRRRPSMTVSWEPSASPPGASAERPARARIPTPTSSRRNATASTCSSISAARSTASWPRWPTIGAADTPRCRSRCTSPRVRWAASWGATTPRTRTRDTHRVEVERRPGPAADRGHGPSLHVQPRGR